MDIKLQSPLKKATTRTGWPHELRSLDDLKRCITQGFGEDLSGPACNFNSSYPCDKTLYQQLGLQGHNGLDIACETGTEVFAPIAGLATFTQDAARGLGITITNADCKVVLWHLKSSVIPLNGSTNVVKGDLVGLSDSTGYSTAPHLHLGLKLLTDGQVLNRDNGYDGAIDPTPYLTWFNTMTQEEVNLYYIMAFNREADAGELAFWTNKQLLDLLKAGIRDRAAFLKQHDIQS